MTSHDPHDPLSILHFQYFIFFYLKWPEWPAAGHALSAIFAPTKKKPIQKCPMKKARGPSD